LPPLNCFLAQHLLIQFKSESMRQSRVGFPPPQNVKSPRVQNEGVRTERRQARKSLAWLAATRSAVGECRVLVFTVQELVLSFAVFTRLISK